MFSGRLVYLRRDCYLGGQIIAANVHYLGTPDRPVVRATGRHERIKRADSSWVSVGTRLVRQLGVVIHPGLNVGIGKDCSLFAMVTGKLYKTTEKFTPNWNSNFCKLMYEDLNDTDIPVYKTYLHVIPDPMPQTFKLVDQV